MSTDDIPGQRKPPRAEPIQPDRPGRGVGSEDDSASKGGNGHDVGTDSDSAQRQKKQSDDALDNVREGYG